MEIIVYDHQIIAVNRNQLENFSNSLIYKSKDGLHQIDFEECSKNFQDLYQASSGRCIGERNIEKEYFLLYTSGIHTKIVFKKAFVFRFQNYLLNGSKQQRFLELQKLIAQTKYTTYDLT